MYNYLRDYVWIHISVVSHFHHYMEILNVLFSPSEVSEYLTRLQADCTIQNESIVTWYWYSKHRGGELLLSLLFFFYDVFIYLDISVTGKDRKLFHPLYYSLDGHSGYGWAKLKSGTKSFIWVSPMDTGPKGPVPSSTALPVTLAVIWVRKE